MKTLLLSFFLFLFSFVKAQTFTDSDIPVVLIDTYGGTIVDEPKITAHFKLFYNGPGVRNYLTDVPAYEGEIGIELRGSYSMTFPQKSYNIALRDAAGQDLDTVLLGMPKEHDWCLISNYNDKAFSRNTLAQDLFRKMEGYSPRSRFCEVVIDGDYKGIYLFSETIKRDNNRVDIAKLDSTEITIPDVTGGYIIKNDYWDASDSWLSSYGPVDHPSFDVHLVYHYPKPAKLQPAQKTYIQGFVNDFESTLYSPGFADNVTGYRQYADPLSFADYFIINELSRNYDGFMHSFYFNKDKNGASPGKLKCGPVWDFDWGFESIYVGSCTDFAAADGSGWAYLINDCSIHSVNSTGWHVRMLQDTSFANLLRCRWETLRQTILDTTYLFGHIDSVAAYLNEAQARHYARWGHIASNVGGCHVTVPATFPGHVALIKNWLAARVTWLDANIPGNAANCSFTGVQEAAVVPLVRIFPNPAADLVFIEESSWANAITVSCRDMCGRLVSTGSGASVVTLDVSRWSSGIYDMEVLSNGISVHRKLSVQH
jgi:hypothetical protein